MVSLSQCFDNLTNAKRLLREIKILRMLSHHNVIGYRGLLAPSIPATFNSLLIVFEFVDTDLAKLLASDQPITNQHVQVCLRRAPRRGEGGAGCVVALSVWIR